MAENVTLEKVLLGDTTKEYVDKVNKAIENVNSNADAIENLNIAVENAGKVDGVKVNNIPVTLTNKIVDLKVSGGDNISIATTDGTGALNISAPNVAKSLTLSVDTSTYVLTAKLLGKDNKVLSTQTVDLPLETMVVDAAYDGTTKEIVLTLQNGNTASFSVADLVAGLVATDNNFTDGQVLVADGNGKKAKSSGYTIKTSVPANAKFTDTTYEDATTSNRGLMPAADKAKLDRIDKSLLDVTATEIGKVQDVRVNGTTVLGSGGVANITIDDLKAGYVSVLSSSLVDFTVNGTKYKAIKVADTDTALEVYNSAGNKILTHTVIEGGYLYICVGTTAIDCTLRKVNGNSVSSGSSTGGSSDSAKVLTPEAVHSNPDSTEIKITKTGLYIVSFGREMVQQSGGSYTDEQYTDIINISNLNADCRSMLSMNIGATEISTSIYVEYNRSTKLLTLKSSGVIPPYKIYSAYKIM